MLFIYNLLLFSLLPDLAVQVS